MPARTLANPAPVAAALIVPIGQYAGAVAPDHEVLRRGVAEPLTEGAFRGWVLAHGPLDPIVAARIAWTHTELVRYAELAGLGDASEQVTDLLRRHLLAEVPCFGSAAVDFARRHRAVPLMLGLGNTADEPGQFALGYVGEAMVYVDAEAYEVWLWSAVEQSLWSACEAASPDGDAGRVLTGFLAGLHRLTSASALYLDVVAR